MDDKVAFVFRHPTPDIGGSPRSLRDLFGVKDGIDPPSLTDRIQLALYITQSLRGLHRAGWLHKDLRSENIIFFPAKEDKAIQAKKTNILEPILAGFSFARFASPSEISEQPSTDPKQDIYRHPSAMGEPSVSFNATMDVYSLGTILIEIAEWRALKHIVSGIVNVDDSTVPLSKIAHVKPFLLSGKGKGGTSKLRMRMGDIYNRACMMCLSGVWEKPKENPDVQLYPNPTLLDAVITELESCRV
jgi:serine/threonine protein kinase